MKVFISADIEGCCGVFSNIETHKNEAVYAPFAKQMTKEVLAVCEAAHEAGADEIVVKDGHGDASNIDPLQMPSYVTLIRGKSGHPYNMMFGLDPTFDAVLMLAIMRRPAVRSLPSAIPPLATACISPSTESA